MKDQEQTAVERPNYTTKDLRVGAFIPFEKAPADVPDYARRTYEQGMSAITRVRADGHYKRQPIPNDDGMIRRFTVGRFVRAEELSR